MTYWIKKPGRGRASWSILGRDGKNPAETVKDPRLDAINKGYKSGAIDYETARDLVTKIKNELRQPAAPRYSIAQVNQDLYDAALKKLARRRRTSADSKRSARDFLRRALTAVGNLSIHAAKIEDLQARVDAYPPAKQRRLATWLNVLLTVAGRQDRAELAPAPHPEVRYLTEEEFLELLPKLPDDRARLVFRLAFYTGARVGELFALGAYNVKSKTVPVLGQMHRNGTLSVPKNRKTGPAVVLEGGAEALKEWVRVGVEEKKKLRQRDWSRLARKASAGAITFHDLRHSYAIKLISAGVPENLVARSMRNSVAVVERYYAGHKLTDEMSELVHTILRRNRAAA